MSSLTYTNNTCQPLKSCTIFAVTKILHCPTGKPYTTFVFLNTVFLISGLVHVGGECMMLDRLGLRAFWFFLLQGLAVSVETIVSNALSLSRSSARKATLPTPKFWPRIVGYVWLLLWFWWSWWIRVLQRILWLTCEILPSNASRTSSNVVGQHVV